MSQSPFEILRREMGPPGARLEAGTVTAVGTGKVTVNIAGSIVPDIPVAGPMPLAGDRVWIIRQGMTAIAIISALDL